MINNKTITILQLKKQIALGEHSKQQFKRRIDHHDSLAAELTAFSNSGGGTLFIGISDDGSIVGLDLAEVQRTNQMLSNAASQHMRPPY